MCGPSRLLPCSGGQVATLSHLTGRTTTVVIKTSDRVLKKIEGIVRDLIEEGPTDGLAFGPILVMSRPDNWDEERVFIFVVYDGKPEKLDIGWASGFVDKVIQRTGVEDLPVVPFDHFVHKSEWPKFYRHNVEPWIPATS